MTWFFFFIFTFSSMGKLIDVESSKLYNSYADCVHDRERIMLKKRIDDEHKVYSQCSGMNITALPRCY